jgi:PKD repeat protein
MKTRSGSGFAAASALLAALVIGVPAASAVVVHTPSGQFLGIVPHGGVAAASIPGSVAAQHGANLSSNGTLNYHGGPVTHSSAAYLVFWTPNGFSIPASSRALLQRYFTDSAADSGTSGNAFAVARQFTDGSGFADYKQTFSASSQVISDTQGYPVRDQAHCPENIPNAENGCVTDAQIQAELQRLVTALGLPHDGSAGASSLPANAPIYFVVLPPDINVCDSASSCADNLFCAYHSSFGFGSPSKELLYATVPFLAAAQFPKNCQFDGNTRIQEPNGDLADVALKFLSHEHNETITDPTGGGWYDNASGNEDGDNCNATGPSNPHGGSSPNAFLPALGGSASAGTLYDELIGGHQYYLQSEWSNGDIGCRMAPSAGSITPQFTVPSSIVEGTSASFNPTASGSTNPISSATWDFGDGATTFKTTSPLAAVSHTYAAPGQFTVKLTLVDNRGNLVSTTQQVTVVDEAPTAAFTIAPSHPAVGQPVSFDGSSSSDPDGSVASYSWDFGDGSSITGPNTVTPSHSYSAAGVYTVTLRVTDTSGVSSSTTRQVPVGVVASFAVTSPPPLLQGQSVNFDAGNSLASPGSTITSYNWDFGDNTSIVNTPNPTTSHTYAHYGSYTVTLKVTDTSNATATTTQMVVVHEHPPTASFTVQTAMPLAGQPVLFDGSSSSDPDGPITSYFWNFGDGGTAGGATPSHTYASYGTYSVTLTVTVADGQTASTTKQVVVKSVPVAAFAVLTRNPAVGRPVVFDGSRSSDPTTSIVSYSWDFGDGATGTGSIPSHAYSTYGTYTVTLTIIDANGLSNSTSQQVAVHDPPIGRFSVSPAQPVVGSSVGFDATGSSDPEPGATISAYSWSFGDGATGTGPRVTHTYRKPGSYRVALTVTDTAGTTATAHRVLRIAPPRITRLQLRSNARGATMVITVNSAGVVSSAHTSIRVRHRGSVRLPIRLSTAQLQQLRRGGSVTLQVTLRFAPRLGPSSHLHLKIVFSLPLTHGRRVYARLRH